MMQKSDNECGALIGVIQLKRERFHIDIRKKQRDIELN